MTAPGNHEVTAGVGAQAPRRTTAPVDGAIR
jgi:hypothetical protein